MQVEHLINEKYCEIVNRLFPGREEGLRNLRMMKHVSDYKEENCPSEEIINEITKLSATISTKEFDSFNTKFKYIKRDDAEFFLTVDPILHIQLFKSQDKGRHLGHYNENNIWLPGRCVAIHVYTLTTYHSFHTNDFFGGSVGELIVQLPSKLRESDKKFYYTLHQYCIKDTPNCHSATIHFYERTE